MIEDKQEAVVFTSHEDAMNWWNGFLAGQETPNLHASPPIEDTDAGVWVVVLIDTVAL